VIEGYLGIPNNNDHDFDGWHGLDRVMPSKAETKCPDETSLRRERQLEGVAKAEAAGVFKGRPTPEAVSSSAIKTVPPWRRRAISDPRGDASRLRSETDEHGHAPGNHGD